METESAAGCAKCLTWWLLTEIPRINGLRVNQYNDKSKIKVLADVWLVGSAACSRFGFAGREQASIQHGRVIQAGLKLNSGHSMHALTFLPYLVTLPVFF